MKPKNSGNDLKGIGNNDVGYLSQIFLPNTMGNDPMSCGFVYMIIFYMEVYQESKRFFLKTGFI